MSSDKKLLLSEFSRNPQFANFMISQMKRYECLVLESSHRQELYFYTAPDDSQSTIDESEDQTQSLEQQHGHEEQLNDHTPTVPNSEECLKEELVSIDESLQEVSVPNVDHSSTG